MSGSWLKLTSLISWPISGAGSVAFGGENPKSPSRLYRTAPGRTGPPTKASGTKSIPVNDESAPSMARGAVIVCGGNASTLAIGTSFARTSEMHAGNGLFGGDWQRSSERPPIGLKYRLARRQEAKSIGPSVIIRAAIRVLAPELKPFWGVVGWSRTALVFAVLADEQTSGQRMILGWEADRVGVSIPPREGLDVARIAQLCSQDSAVADPLSNLLCERVEES